MEPSNNNNNNNNSSKNNTPQNFGVVTRSQSRQNNSNNNANNDKNKKKRKLADVPPDSNSLQDSSVSSIDSGSSKKVKKLKSTVLISSPSSSITTKEGKDEESVHSPLDDSIKDSPDVDSRNKEEIGSVTSTEPNYSSINFNIPLSSTVVSANSGDDSFRFLDTEIWEDLCNLRMLAHSVVNKLPRGSSNVSLAPSTWGILTPRNFNYKTIELTGTSFTVGGNGCNLVVSSLPPLSSETNSNEIAALTTNNLPTSSLGNSNNNVLFKLSLKGSMVYFESNSNNVSVGGKTGKKNSCALQSGDEISFSTGSNSKPYVLGFEKTKTKPVESNSSSSSSSSSSSASSSLHSPFSSLTKTGFPLSSDSPKSAPRKRKSLLSIVSDPMEMEQTDFASLPPPLSETDIEVSKKQTETIKNQFKQDFKKLMIHPKDINISFDNFPYYLNDKSKQLLITSGYVYLKKPEFIKFISDLPHSRKILLSGSSGTELYQECLVKALAKYFEASILILDPSHFDLEKSSQLEMLSEESETRRLLTGDTSKSSYKSKKNDLTKHVSSLRIVRASRHSNGIMRVPTSEKESSLDDDSNWTDHIEPPIPPIDNEDKLDTLFFEALFETLSEDKKPCILFIKEIENIANSCGNAFKKELNHITSPLIVIASSVSPDLKKEKNHPSLVVSKSSGHTALLDFAFFDHFAKLEERAKESSKTTRTILKLFPNRISVNPPTNPDEMSEWSKQIARDTEQLKLDKNIRNLRKILEKNNIECSDLNSNMLRKEIFSTENLDKVVGWGVIDHLMSTENIESVSDKLTISLKSIENGLVMLKNSDPESKTKTLKDIDVENEFERRLLSEVIPPNELDIKFEDIGALDEVKRTLQELVMLPLQRPELFSKGNLTNPCKGILLFGPPGTGKTMLAKAVATQSGANFINISMSSIASKWFGEGEKYVKAAFTLASKIAPTVIFVDEVDSILGKRDRPGEHEAMRKIKNEFMSNWDGLRTKSNERVLVMGATNRPFDLDDAVLRRLPRRIMVDLPSAENRIKILKVILKNEDLSSDFDFEKLSFMTEGFSGSDLKNLCIAAAYQPIREILEREKQEKENNKKTENETMEKDVSMISAEQKEAEIRPLRISDFEKSLKEISASVSEEAFSIGELRKWNEIYGEGGNRKKETLTYFM